MDIAIIPNDHDVDFSLYAYQIELNNNSIVHYLLNCVSCEADYKCDRSKRGKTQDQTRIVERLKA